MRLAEHGMFYSYCIVQVELILSHRILWTVEEAMTLDIEYIYMKDVVLHLVIIF